MCLLIGTPAPPTTTGESPTAEQVDAPPAFHPTAPRTLKTTYAYEGMSLNTRCTPSESSPGSAHLDGDESIELDPLMSMRHTPTEQANAWAGQALGFLSP
jgi:hypothetical protein